MKKYLIFVFNNGEALFDEVEDFTPPTSVPPDCVYFYFIFGVYDPESQSFTDGVRASSDYYVNATIVQVEYVDQHFKKDIAEEIKQQIKEANLPDLYVLKLNNGVGLITNMATDIFFTINDIPESQNMGLEILN